MTKVGVPLQSVSQKMKLELDLSPEDINKFLVAMGELVKGKRKVTRKVRKKGKSSQVMEVLEYCVNHTDCLIY